MFGRKSEKEIDVKKVNTLVSLANNVLKILIILLVVVGGYAGIMLLKELKVLPFILTILKLISPLFIGIVVAWLLDPIVDKLGEKGIRRGLGAAICYFAVAVIIFLIVNALIPLLSEQINDFVSTTVPSVFDASKNWIDNIFDKFNTIENFDAIAMKNELFVKLESFTANLTSSLPTILVNAVTSVFSGLGTFVIGLIIGFYLLLDFDKNTKAFYELIPVKLRSDIYKLIEMINVPLRKFVQGALIDCSIVFVISFIGFAIIGLKAPLLFALFCGLTNIIPYAGPYIGGAPAVLVALSQGTTTGIIVLIFIVIVQMLEGNLIQPLIMSKTTKISPIAIILGLLVFGHFFGIVGMILATPIIGTIKSIIQFLDEKYELFTNKEDYS